MKTGTSKRLAEILTLGERLVQELELDQTTDTLSRWMAHHLAELMTDLSSIKDKKQRKAAESRCVALILKLWERRVTLPGGVAPLANLKPILSALVSLVGNNESWVGFARHAVKSEHINDPWIAFVEETYSGDRRLALIAVLTSIAERTFDREKRWLVDGKGSLSKEEEKIIRLLDSWLEAERDWLTRKDKISIGRLSPEERRRTTIDELEAIVSKQQEALNNLKQGLGEK